ncbi:MAG: hypothetical protein LC623_05665 [Halobacteriales archaeon]|nr:hypothetical protein [Halobacteriales archaeon]
MSGESFVSWTQTAITTPDEIRKMTGLKQETDIPSADLTALISKAQVLVTQELSERIHDVALWGGIDGANTRFALPARFTGRVLLDVLNTQDEKAGIQVHLRRITATGPPTYDAATVSSVDALHGQVVLSAAPDPSIYDSVRFTGFLVRAAVTKQRFMACVEFYAAHLALTRARGPGRVVPSNPNATSDKGGETMFSTGTFLKLYEKELRGLRNVRGGVAATRADRPDRTGYVPAEADWS